MFAVYCKLAYTKNVECKKSTEKVMQLEHKSALVDIMRLLINFYTRSGILYLGN